MNSLILELVLYFLFLLYELKMETVPGGSPFLWDKHSSPATYKRKEETAGDEENAVPWKGRTLLPQA